MKKIYYSLPAPFGAYLLMLLSFLFTLHGCDSTKKAESITIYTDISFKPVIDQQLYTFNHLFEGKQKTQMVYAPESDCFDALMQDSTRMIIVSRELTANEKNYFRSKKTIVPRSSLIAYDAIAVITNKTAKNQQFTLADIKHLMTTQNTSTPVVIEGTTASSTLLYLIHKMDIQTKDISTKLLGGKTSKEIINFVKNTPNGIGIVGIAALGGLDIPQEEGFFKDIHVASLLNERDSMFTKPYQANIMNGVYPLVRPVYFIVKEMESGPGLRFGRFMSNESGQLIFKRAYWAPATMSFKKRVVHIK